MGHQDGGENRHIDEAVNHVMLPRKSRDHPFLSGTEKLSQTAQFYEKSLCLGFIDFLSFRFQMKRNINDLC